MGQQTDVEVKEEETSEEKFVTIEKIKVSHRILGEVKYFKEPEREKATPILISKFLSFDTMKRLKIDESGTELIAANFFNDLQQPTKKKTIDHFSVLALLDVSSRLTTKTISLIVDRGEIYITGRRPIRI